MRFASCFVLLVALEVTPTTSSSIAHLRRQRETSSSTDKLILNSTNVVEVQLSPGSTSLKFEVCHKPKCKGTMIIWFSATGTDSSAERHKDGFCYFQHGFPSANLRTSEDCNDGEISESKFRFLLGSGNNPCGIEISDDRRLKVQLESLVEGCEVRVTNGVIWTDDGDGGSNVKLGLAVGIPVSIIVVIGVVTLFVIFVGRPWWKKRKTTNNRGTVSKDALKPSSSVIPPAQTSPCPVTPAVPLAFPTPPTSSVPAASCVPPLPRQRCLLQHHQSLPFL